MDLIHSFIVKYKKEYDFYEMSGKIVAQQLDIKLQASGIRSIVTTRAKNIKRLEEKIRKRSNQRETPYSTHEEINNDIKDLAGVRVDLYFPGERDEVDKIIKDIFDQYSDPKEFIGTTNPSFEKRFSGYWATHYRVRIHRSTLNDNQQRYCDATVEIQVASVLMHAWSEVEHDLVYKPTKGNISEEENAILDQLNGLVLSGEIALERLQKAVEARVNKQDRLFENHYELASYLFEVTKLLFKEKGKEPIIGEVDILFSFLKKLNMLSPDNISLYITTLHPETDKRSIAQQIIDQMITAHEKRYSIYSDILKEGNKISDHKEKAIGNFISKWIKFERFINELATVHGLSPNIVSMKKLKIFDDDKLNEVEYIRRARNYLIHGIEMPDADYIEALGNNLEKIMKDLLNHSDEDVSVVAKKIFMIPQ